MTNRVLFIDDEDKILASIRRSVLLHGFLDWECEYFTDPNKALDAHKEKAFDLIVTDLKMPVLDGFGVAKIAQNVNKATKVIILSGTADMSSALRIINQSNVSKLLLKPCDFSIMINEISNCFSEQLSLSFVNDLSKDVINKLSVGVLITDRQRNVLFANDRAQQFLLKKDGLYITSTGKLNASSSKSNVVLGEILKNYAEEEAKLLKVECQDLYGHIQLNIVTIAEYPSFLIIFVSTEESNAIPSEMNLAVLYNMPPSEARFLHLLLAGYNVKTASEKLQIKESSGRTYLKRIFSRTNTKSQSDLIRKILTSPQILIKK